MKVLYIDIETGGHHQTYLKALMDIPGKENVLVLPEKIEGLNAKQYVFRKTVPREDRSQKTLQAGVSGNLWQ